MTDHLTFTASLVALPGGLPLAAPDRGPDRLGLHLLFAFGCLLLFIAAVDGMRRSWRHRAKRQEEDLPDMPEVPEQTGAVVAAPLKGLYLGTVDAGHWLDRITARGLGGRADAYVSVYDHGIRVDRAGSEPFWIPREAVRGARLERAHGGKVAGVGRIIVIAWSLGAHELETGLRGDDRARQPKVVRAVHALIGPLPAPMDGEVTKPRPVGRAVSRLRPRVLGTAAQGQLPTAMRPPEGTGPDGTVSPERSPGALDNNPPVLGPSTVPGMPHPQGASTIPVVTRAPSSTAVHGPRPTLPEPGLPEPTYPRTGRSAAAGGTGGQERPAGGPGHTTQAVHVDPLTSPLGEVVRKMKDTWVSAAAGRRNGGSPERIGDVVSAGEGEHGGGASAVGGPPGHLSEPARSTASRAGGSAGVRLMLEDGRSFTGEAFGVRGETFGEVVFATGMTGYQETLTDPSYHRQIVVMTAPHIGNTGVNDDDNESEKIHVAGFVVRDPSRIASSWRAQRTLDDELVAAGVVGVSGIDTRALTRHLRERGAMRCGIGSAAQDPGELLERVRTSPSMVGADLAPQVSTPAPYVVPAATDVPYFRVAALDLGMKRATPNALRALGCEVHVLPARSSGDALLELAPDGVFLSNGPGDPAAADYAVQAVRRVLDAGVPVFGICFGNQVLARALGFETYKLTYGHRGVNQPVADIATGRIMVTSHNHGFAVRAPRDGVTQTPYGRVEVSHVALNDGVVEGLACLDVPAFSVQFHPEAAPGPHDAHGLFERFRDLMAARR